MKTTLTVGGVLLAVAGMGQNVETVQTVPGPGSATPPVSIVRPAPTNATYAFHQQLWGGRPVLVTLDQANAIIDKFKEAYPKLESPRLVLFINRELVDEKSGLRVASRTEKSEATNAAARIAGANRNAHTKRTGSAPADRQSSLEMERLFGRPLRMAGAVLLDQRLVAGDPNASATDSAEAGAPESLAKIADVAIEVLLTSKNVTVAEISGDRTYSLPEIKATAIRLRDSRVLAQASSYDVTSRYSPATVRLFSLPELAEATALVLMEDMLNGVPAAEEKK